MSAAALLFNATPGLAVGTLTLSAPKGVPTGGYTITATQAGATAFATGAAVEFSYGACAATYTTAVAAAGGGTTLTAGVVPATTTAVTSTAILTVTVPATLFPTGMTAANWYVCAYVGSTAGTSALNVGTASATFQITPGAAALSPAKGPSGGGNVITATTNLGTFTSSSVVEFSYTTCAATYATPTAVTASAPTTQTGGILAVPTGNVVLTSGTVLTITVPSTVALLTSAGQTEATYTVCVYAGTTAGSNGIISASATGGYLISGTLSLNVPRGPSAGGNTITATTVGGVFTSTPTVEFQYVGSGTAANCSPVYTTPAAVHMTGAAQDAGNVAAITVVRLSTTKVAVTVPAGVALGAGQTSADYNICAYSGTNTTTSGLISGTSTAYTIAARAAVTAIQPMSGSTQGGTNVNIVGTFPSGVTGASIAGIPLTGVTLVDSNTVSGVMPAHAAGGPFNLVVNTPAGNVTLNSVFTYTTGISLSLSTGPNSGVVNLDVAGTGFNGLTLNGTTGTTPNSADGHVYLVRGGYDPTTDATTTFKTNGDALECVNALVIADNELICSMYLAGDARPIRGTLAYTDVTVTSGSKTLTSASAAFTPDDVGLTVNSSDVPDELDDGTYIAAVVDATTVTLSRAATASKTNAHISFEAYRTFSDGVIALGTSTTTLTSASGGAFVAEDIGRTITGPGILPGTTITAVGSGTSLTLSKAANVSGTALSITIGALPVADGTYTVTLVTNGALDASSTDTVYNQSVICSGATFTVADY